MAKHVIAAVLLALSSPLAAADDQIVIDFDDLDAGTGGFTFNAFGHPLFENMVFGGIVSAATALDPAVSGPHVYLGTSIGFNLTDPFDFSWPGIGAFFTTRAPVTVTLSAYDYALPGETGVFTTVLPAGVTNFYFGFGSVALPGSFTSARFESAESFSIDDFTFGLVGVAPGIPEPASWAMMIAGLSLAGASLRHRRMLVRFG